MPIVRRKKHTMLLVWLPMALMISFSVYFVAKWGLNPKPIPQINPTQFEKLEQIGAVTYRRLQPSLRQEKLVILGSSINQPEYEKIWNGFIAAAREDHWNIDLVFADPALRQIKDFQGLTIRPLAWPNPTEKLASELKENLKFGRLVLIHTTSEHSSHRGESSLTKELENELKRPWTTITMLEFATNEDEIQALQPKCDDEVSPQDKTQYVACAAYRISKKYLRKKLDSTAMWAALERHGLKDYFLFVHPNF